MISDISNRSVKQQIIINKTKNTHVKVNLQSLVKYKHTYQYSEDLQCAQWCENIKIQCQ